jgi:hypothetical protein
MSLRRRSTGNLMGLASVAAANLFLLTQGIMLLLGEPLYLYLFVSMNMVLIQAVVRGKPLRRSHATFLILAAICAWLCARPQLLRGVNALLYWYCETTADVAEYYRIVTPGFDHEVRFIRILVSFLLSAIAAAIVGSQGRRRETQVPGRPLSPSLSATRLNSR